MKLGLPNFTTYNQIERGKTPVSLKLVLKQYEKWCEAVVVEHFKGIP